MRNKEYTGSYNAYHEFQDSLEKIHNIIGNINRKYIMPERIAYIDSLFDAKNPDNIRDMEENAGIFVALCHEDGNKLLPDLLKAADKHGVDWCQKVVSFAKNDIIMNANRQLSKEFQQDPSMPISGVYLDIDLAEIKSLYEYSIDSTHITGYREHQQIRDNYREALFNMIADGKTLYSYEELKEFYVAPKKKQEMLIICANDEWKDETNVFETDAYKRAMKRIEFDILKHENNKAFEENDFSGFSKEQKKLVLENTDSKDVAKAIVDSYKGNVEYNDLIGKHFGKDEFEQIVEDYKITQYRRENERLTEENKQIKAQAVEENKRLSEEQKAVEKARLRVEAKEKELGFLKDISTVLKGTQKEVDSFSPDRKQQIFDRMVDEAMGNSNLLESYLSGICKIYVSETNTPEAKAQYFKDLHSIRKSYDSNAKNREMARTFGRVLERNPELAKDEALQGLAKIDYSAIGIKPTERGFKRDSGGRRA